MDNGHECKILAITIINIIYQYFIWFCMEHTQYSKNKKGYINMTRFYGGYMK